MSNDTGGYDAGYAAVPCFWGLSPGSLVSEFLKEKSVKGINVLDAGAGEGKNAAAFSEAGATVDAIEISEIAIRNGKNAFPNLPINWLCGDITKLDFLDQKYDVIVCYGLLHCLQSEKIVSDFIGKAKLSLRESGAFILVAFNDGPHDLSAHPGFNPLLLSHDWYLSQFAGWNVSSSDKILHEIHPNNGIAHYHSLTRLVAKCP